jgi:hypothetical protein
MTGFSDSQCHLNRFQISHLATSKRPGLGAERCGARAETVRISGDFALIDDTAFMIV